MSQKRQTRSKIQRPDPDGPLYILLADWAEQHNIPLWKAKDLARRGWVKDHTKLLPYDFRYFVPKNLKPRPQDTTR